MHVMDLPKTKGLPRNYSFLMRFWNTPAKKGTRKIKAL